MKKFSTYRLVVLNVFVLLNATSCISQKGLSKREGFVKYPCDLKEHINDTIVVSGIYSGCMEYESFDLVEKDDCYDEFQMDLDFNRVEFTTKIEKRLDKIQDCAASMKLVLKGILRKEKDSLYGHLGSNTAEFEILEFIDYGRVKFKKMKTE